VKILVVSDTHSNVSGVLRIVRQHGDFDLFFHLGDTYHDAQKIQSSSGLAMRAVSGNMDGLRVGPETEVFDLEGSRFLLTHGDRFGVNRSLLGLNLAAEAAVANIVCFGHTHRPCNESLHGRFFLNPGSLRGANGTYGILRVEDGHASFEIYPALR